MAWKNICETCLKSGVPDLIRAFSESQPTKIEFHHMTWNLTEAKRSSTATLPHHRTYALLAAAADEGCLACAAFRQALVDHWKITYSWPEEKTVKFHNTIEQHFDAPFSVFPSTDRFAHLEYIRPHMFTDPRGIEDEAKTVLANYLESEGMATPRVHIASDLQCRLDMMRRISDKPRYKTYIPWIRYCAKRHKSCGPIVAKPLPTRVIDIGESPRNNPRLRHTAGQLGVYVTLSHCWGGWRKLVTDDSNYLAHLKEIPLDVLPRTFRDAVEITRELGYRYLWIDSLCIIQGNREDWEIEGARMCQIYEDSCLTIAGPNAPNPEAGILHPRLPSPYHSVDLGRNKNGARISLISTRSDCEHPPRIEYPLYGSILGERGWCLQERLLAPRVLFFFQNYLYMECREHDFSELSWTRVEPAETYNMIPKTQLRALFADDQNPEDSDSASSASDPEHSDGEPSEGEHTPDASSDSSTSADETPAPDARPPANQEAIHKAWWRLVENFSTRHLSFPGDKLPAVQGMVAYFHTRAPDTYLAGLWRADLLHHLSWFRIIRADTPSTAVAAYRAPSWSWAAVDGEVCFHAYYFRCQKFDAAQPYRFAVVLGAETKAVGKSPFGQVEGGWLRLRAPVRRFRVGGECLFARIHVGKSRAVKLWGADGVAGEEVQVASLLPDEDGFFGRVPHEGMEVECALLWQNVLSLWCALVIEKTGDADGSYNRIGFLSTMDFFNHSQMGPFDWTDVPEREVLIV